MIVGQILVGLTAAQCHMASPLPAGLTGARLEIRYAHPKWKTLNRLVTFRAGKVSRSVWEEDGTVTIPWEVLEKSGIPLMAGITGTDAARQIRIPTVPIALCRIQSGTLPAEGETDPTLPIWAQLDSRLRTVETNVAEQLKNALEEAKNGGAFDGDPATVLGFSTEYQVSQDGTQVPQGDWSAAIPQVPQGQYLWTRTATRFNTGEPVVCHSVTRMGLDGRGSVSSVADISPDEEGNVPLTAEDVGALSSSGGGLTGELRMNGQPISGLPQPTARDQAANMDYVNHKVRSAAPRNLLDNSDFTNPVNQRGRTSYVDKGYTIDRWLAYNDAGLTVRLREGYLELVNSAAQTVHFIQKLERILPVGQRITFAVALEDGTVLSAAGTVSDNGSICNMYTEDFSAYYNVSSGWATFGIYQGRTARLKWTALYEGEYTPDTLPRYRPRSFSAELAECRRYYRKSWVGSLGELVPNGAVSFVCGSGAGSQPVVTWETPMIRTPDSVSVYSWAGGAGCVRDWAGSGDVSGIAVNYASPTGFALTNLSGLTAGKVYAFHYEASAEL